MDSAKRQRVRDQLVGFFGALVLVAIGCAAWALTDGSVVITRQGMRVGHGDRTLFDIP